LAFLFKKQNNVMIIFCVIWLFWVKNAIFSPNVLAKIIGPRIHLSVRNESVQWIFQLIYFKFGTWI
jgi:hypothetical protein